MTNSVFIFFLYICIYLLCILLSVCLSICPSLPLSVFCPTYSVFQFSPSVYISLLLYFYFFLTVNYFIPLTLNICFPLSRLFRITLIILNLLFLSYSVSFSFSHCIFFFYQRFFLFPVFIAMSLNQFFSICSYSASFFPSLSPPSISHLLPSSPPPPRRPEGKSEVKGERRRSRNSHFASIVMDVSDTRRGLHG